MFQKLRDAFREAVDNFREELNRDAVPGAAGDRYLTGMRREMEGAEAYLERLEREIREAEEEAARERADGETCRRREAMARRIEDGETARIAAEFAQRHERREQVLKAKAAALRDELAIRREEAREMRSTYQEAAELRRSAVGSKGSAGDPDLRRVREALDRRSAEREVEELLRDFDPPNHRPSESELQARLEELKRRMRNDGA